MNINSQLIYFPQTYVFSRFSSVKILSSRLLICFALAKPNSIKIEWILPNIHHFRLKNIRPLTII